MDVISYLAGGRETEPVGAVVLHRHRDRHLALYHDIEDAPDGGAPLLGAGRMLTYDALRDLSQRLTGTGGLRTILPASVLCAETDLLAWWRPSMRRPIIFQTQDKALNAALSGQPVLHPPLLFVGRPGAIAVYALPGQERPTEQTPLFRAPYLNLYATGSMCEGTAPLPAVCLPEQDVLSAYEAAFYDSAFVHTNLGQGQMVRWPGGHRGFWEAMAKTHGSFPAHALVPLRRDRAPLTVQDVLNTPSSRLRVDLDTEGQK